MAFPVFNNKLTPEEVSPWGNLLSHALAKYQALNKAQYAPERERADIFSKEIGPLAGLASSPNFTGFNPEVQKMISNRVSSYLGHGQKMLGQPESTTPGYASDEDIYKRLKQGADVALSPGGKSKVAKSRLAGVAEQFGLPNAISKYLGGNQAAGENAAFEQAQEEAVQKLKLKGYSEGTARQALEKKPGESNESYSSRIKSLFVSREKEQPIKSSEQKEYQDAQSRADAEATAEAFGTTPEMVLQAQSMGVKTAKEFKEFLKWSQQ